MSASARETVSSAKPFPHTMKHVEESIKKSRKGSPYKHRVDSVPSTDLVIQERSSSGSDFNSRDSEEELNGSDSDIKKVHQMLQQPEPERITSRSNFTEITENQRRINNDLNDIENLVNKGTVENKGLEKLK